MPPKANPLNLNALQLKTLVLFQELARHPELSTASAETGEVLLTRFPHAHGDHMHVGSKMVAAKDATGLGNPAVWTALERKGLVKGSFPVALRLTKEGLAYDTEAMAAEILHGGGHH
jgi:hypothetical protein